MNQFNKGLHTDNRELYQPEGTYRFALNAINEADTGNLGSLSNEPGNYECFGLDQTSFPVGNILLSNDESVLFITRPGVNDSILLLNHSSCSYTVLFSSECLDFQRQIQGVRKVLNGCDRNIYWVDGTNPDRVMNIDAILRNPDPADHPYYTDGNPDCSLLAVKRDYNIPTFNDITINNYGGKLALGPYSIVLQYEDSYGNQTNCFGMSLPEPIVYGNYGADYNSITGGDPLSYPLTTKSISFNLSSLDTRFEYINIIVGHYENGIESYFRVDRLPISTNTLDYTITELINDDSTRIDIDSIIVDRMPYDTSETISIADDRLVKGNVSGKNRNFAEWQKMANSIDVRYVTKPILYEQSATDSNNPKQSGNYDKYRSFLRDEVYSIGIVGVFTDGTETPVGHIPGRAKNTTAFTTTFPASDPNSHSRPNNNTGVTNTGWDSALIIASGMSGLLDDFKHFPTSPNNGEFETIAGRLYIERWKAFNTAYRTDLYTATNDYYSKGELAYWESNYDYPDLLDCDGERVYPTGKIRHHKMPDTTLEEHFTNIGDNQYIIQLGLEFKNIIIPAEFPDLQGYYIVREDREGNKTILDKGIVHNNYTFDLDVNSEGLKSYAVQSNISNLHLEDNPPFGLMPSFIPIYSSVDTNCGSTSTPIDCSSGDPQVTRSDTSVSFHGPLSKFYKTSLSPSVFKVERAYSGNLYQTALNNYGGSSAYMNRLYVTSEYVGNYIYGSQQTNLLINKTPIYIDSDGEVPQSYLSSNFLNNNSQETLVFETEDSFLNVSSGDGPEDADPINCFYGSLKDYNRNIYGQLNSDTYYKTHTNIISSATTQLVEFGGDTFITKFSFLKTAAIKRCECSIPDYGGNSVDFITVKTLVTYFVESEINTDLRHLDIANLANEQNVFWPNFSGSLLEFFEIDWMGKDEGSDRCSEGAFSPWCQNTYMKNLYLYNKDYSNWHPVKPSFGLDQNYEFCKDCNNVHKTRLVYSEQSLQDDRIDNFRIFYANNFRDLPASYGEVTNLFLTNDELYAQTSMGMFRIITKPYQMQSDQSTLYIGTGEFFSVPPRQIVTTDYGYAGSRQKFGTKSTEFGTITIDDVTGKIFLLSDKLNEISQIGERNWSEVNVPLTFSSQYKNIIGKDYSMLNQPAFPNGIGYSTVYDPRHKRIVITKKDYELLTGTVEENEVLDFSDTTRFKNKSWTKSFSLLNNSWTSYHSYLPGFYFNDSNNFYSHQQGGESIIWQHRDRNYQTYYGQKQDFIIDYIVMAEKGLTSVFNELSYVQKAELYDTGTNHYRDDNFETFSYINVYNSHQTSLKHRIQVKNSSNPFFSISGFGPTIVEASKNEKSWSISELRDYTINNSQTLFTSNWTNILPFYPIDKVLNASAVSVSKPVFEIDLLRDKYMGVRLFYKNSNVDYKITFDLMSSLSEVSFR